MSEAVNEIIVKVSITTKNGKTFTDEQMISGISSALYRLMGEGNWTRVNVTKVPGLDAVQDDNIRLRAEVEEFEQFIVQCTELISEGYDGDESPENIIIRFLKDMDQFASTIARLTSAYR